MKKELLTKIKIFFKKTIAIWIIIGVILTCALGDFIYYKTFSLTLVEIHSKNAPQDQLYFSTSETDEYVELTCLLTSNKKPVKGHSIVAIEKSGGKIVTPRDVSDENGLVHFTFSSNPVFNSKTEKVDGIVYFYDEDNSIIIEFRLDLLYKFILYRRPGGESGD